MVMARDIKLHPKCHVRPLGLTRLCTRHSIRIGRYISATLPPQGTDAKYALRVGVVSVAVRTVCINNFSYKPIYGHFLLHVERSTAGPLQCDSSQSCCAQQLWLICDTNFVARWCCRNFWLKCGKFVTLIPVNRRIWIWCCHHRHSSFVYLFNCFRSAGVDQS